MSNFPELRDAIAKLNAKRDELKAIFDEARNDAGELDASKLKSVRLPDGVALSEYVREKNSEIESLAKEVADLKEIARAADHADADPDVLEGDGDARPRSRMSFGRAFVESDAYRNRQAGQTLTAHLDIDIRNTLFERTAGWQPESTRTGYVDYSPERRPRVIDFVPQLPTGQSSVKFMRETTFDDSAVAEKAEGVAFGEAALALTEITLPVEKIPVWIPVTDEQLEDEPMAEAYLNQRLPFMLRKRLDLQILRGTGVSPLLEGTENVTGIQTQALGADPIQDAIYKLFVKIRDDADNSGGDAEPSAVFIQAVKWQDVRLQRTADGIYIWGNPSEAGPDRVWGVPVVQTNAVTATKAVAGDYAMHSYLAVRRGVDVRVSDSHGSLFVEGKQAIRADIRVAMVHLRPAAFGEVTGL